MKDIRYMQNIKTHPKSHSNTFGTTMNQVNASPTIFKNSQKYSKYSKHNTKHETKPTNDIEHDVAIYIVEPIHGKWGELDPDEDDIRFTKKIIST